MTHKILIVDDETDIVEVVKKRLASAGYTVFTAHDGKDGLRKIEREQPDLVILDVMMPELNGSTLCGILKYDERFKDIPIIMLSVMARGLDKEIGDKVRADAYLTKPFENKELLEIVSRLLKKKKAEH
ncbi:MAG: response regulator transcription factor [Candidatus Omnitrophota bacterium]